MKNQNSSEIECLLNDSISIIESKISKNDMDDVKEYVEHGEYGVACDLLSFLFKKNNLSVPASLSHAAILMGMRETPHTSPR
ncbi:hypothetical protein [Acetobacter fabarum]|jgi:hypothetical protein|uniref:hypothetical protein n=1 Tax=Acetobacter fabarum TaxID=483199 RepID=UPI00209E70F7|nr:hypothetical protein [Acetobacter fabarum]MCP1229363.1 hypothetical protein [Acetobacter fabarum]MCP1234878.1 hypothetical protein [Acetobacter fabarum]